VIETANRSFNIGMAGLEIAQNKAGLENENSQIPSDSGHVGNDADGDIRRSGASRACNRAGG
jgi:hypothetical protein